MDSGSSDEEEGTLRVQFYRVGLVVVDLAWVDFYLNVPPCCLAVQPIQPNSHLPKDNRAGS